MVKHLHSHKSRYFTFIIDSAPPILVPTVSHQRESNVTWSLISSLSRKSSLGLFDQIVRPVQYAKRESKSRMLANTEYPSRVLVYIALKSLIPLGIPLILGVDTRICFSAHANWWFSVNSPQFESFKGPLNQIVGTKDFWLNNPLLSSHISDKTQPNLPEIFKSLIFLNMKKLQLVPSLYKGLERTLVPWEKEWNKVPTFFFQQIPQLFPDLSSILLYFPDFSPHPKTQMYLSLEMSYKIKLKITWK